MADVNEAGEVNVEGQYAGRLEAFRFHQDPSATPDEAKTAARSGHVGTRARIPSAGGQVLTTPPISGDSTSPIRVA